MAKAADNESGVAQDGIGVNRQNMKCLAKVPQKK